MQIRRFGHAAITVADLETAEDFYRSVLGFEVGARYPEDQEVMLTVGEGDHLLLKASGNGAPGLDHVAFELEEGHRQIEAAAGDLEARGIRFQRVDHEGDASLYFRAPDGHAVELYVTPGSTPRFASTQERWSAARRFLYAAARPIDRAVFEHRFEDAPAGRVLATLGAYRNADGGFGHALEPDVRCPSSQPIHVQTALELLREAGIRAPDIANECCEFLSGLATPEAALPALRPDALEYPAAAHWHGPFASEPSLGWTVGLAAELVWHGSSHPWAARAIDAAGGYLSSVEAEAHQLVYAMRFAAIALHGTNRDRSLSRLCALLPQAGLYVAETPVLRYGMTPLHYAPTPTSAAASHFDAGLIQAHLDDLLDAQQGDGGWPIRFSPPSDAARLEWRGRWTVETLGVLRAYGRL